jgi:hypothetical protein
MSSTRAWVLGTSSGFYEDVFTEALCYSIENGER